MAKVRLLHGKPLLVGRKVALNDDCCCAPTPPTDCSSIISITFSGVEFCCACIDDVGGRAEFFEDPVFGVINDVPFGPFTTGEFCDPFICFNNSVLTLPERSSFVPFVCPTGLEDVGVVPFTIAVRLVSSIWYVAVDLLDTRLAIFYGFGADPSSIPNSLTDCTLSPSTFDNPMTCSTGSLDICTIGKNGTASLAF